MKKAIRFSVAAAAVAATGLALTGCAASAPAGDGEVTIFGAYGEAQTKAFQAELDEPGSDVKAPAAPKDAAAPRRRPAAGAGAPRRGGR